jgi:hypothetical protein
MVTAALFRKVTPVLPSDSAQTILIIITLLSFFRCRIAVGKADP